MKRGFALALLFLTTSVVVSAQAHGGGHASAGAGRGGAAHSARPSSFGTRGFSGVTRSRPGSGIAFGHHPGFVTGPNGNRYRRRYYPGIGYFYYPYYSPYYGYYPYDDSGGYDSNAYQQSPPPPPDDYYGSASDWRNSQPPAQAASAAAPEPQDPTVLVFRDGRHLEVRNYAIVGQMLWDFDSKSTQKIPLAELDLDATRKLNDERGMEFVVPKTSS